MPRPGQAIPTQYEYLKVDRMPWLTQALGKGFVRGGVYLLAGEPGVGKSTLILQTLGEFARQGVKVLYVTSEQSVAELNAVVTRLFANGGRLANAIQENLFLEDKVADVEELLKFLTFDVLPKGREYHGVKVIVFDSIQGKGLSANATQKFHALYQFAEVAKANGIVTVLLGHVNKNGDIAGPKTLEHNVDCTLYMRRAFRMRPFFVPKNRFGPAVLDPIPLVMDRDGRIDLYPLASSPTACVLGYPGSGSDAAEVQAAVSLAKYGTTPQLNAPSLPRQKVKQLIKVLGQIEGVDLSELSYQVNAYVPGSRTYSELLDLPLAVSLLSSYLQLPVPTSALFVGEIDLMRRVRPPSPACLERMAVMLLSEETGRYGDVYLSDQVSDAFIKRLEQGEAGGSRCLVSIFGVADLEELLRDLWPSAFR